MGCVWGNEQEILRRNGYFFAVNFVGLGAFFDDMYLEFRVMMSLFCDQQTVAVDGDMLQITTLNTECIKLVILYIGIGLAVYDLQGCVSFCFFGMIIHQIRLDFKGDVRNL